MVWASQHLGGLGTEMTQNCLNEPDDASDPNDADDPANLEWPETQMTQMKQATQVTQVTLMNKITKLAQGILESELIKKADIIYLIIIMIHHI